MNKVSRHAQKNLQRQIFFCCVCIFIFFFSITVYHNYSENLQCTQTERATYSYNAVVFVAFDWSEANIFYYTDQINEIYLKGTIEKQKDGNYLLTCPYNTDFFPQQYVQLGKEKIYITTSLGQYSFQYSSDVIEIIDSFERYQ